MGKKLFSAFSQTKVNNNTLCVTDKDFSKFNSLSGSPAAEDSRFAVRKLDREDRYHGLNDWLAECLEHDGCQMMIPNGEAVDSNTNASQLPTRCLNVGTNDEPALFLEETASNTGGYITLSHRWTDSTSACSTTTSNYLQRLISLDTDLLPRTFQEAIEATRYLQIRFVLEVKPLPKTNDSGLGHT